MPRRRPRCSCWERAASWHRVINTWAIRESPINMGDNWALQRWRLYRAWNRRGKSFPIAAYSNRAHPLAIWKHQPRELPNQLCAIERTVELPLKDWPSADGLERQRLACTDRALEERFRRRRDIRRGLGDGSTFELPIYAWRIGEAVLVGSCCEPYSLLQQELRRRFSDRTVICMNLINGSIGYLPPAALYDTDVYPVWQTPFDRGSLETTIEAMTGVIKDVLGA